MRQAYRHSNQGILVSCQICLVHAMAEGKDGGGNHSCYYDSDMKLESLNCHWMGYDNIPIKMFLLILVLFLLLLLVVLVPPGEAVE